MKETDLSAGLSWKRGFLTQKKKKKNAIQALPQVKEKRTAKIHCPLIKKHKPSSNGMYLQER